MQLPGPLALAFAGGVVVAPLAQRALPGAQAQLQGAPLAPMVIVIAALKDAGLNATLPQAAGAGTLVD